MYILLSIIVSYAIGSISPSFILGKIIGKVDIRELGDGNAGALNTAAVLGIVPGIIAGLFDISKGILSLFLSRHFFNMEENLLLIPICAAIAGHIFPFYLRFRGGQGSATAAGLLLFFLIPLFSSGKLPLDGLLVLSILIAVTAYVARGGEFIGLIVLPMLLFSISANVRRSFPYMIVTLLSGFLCGTTAYNFIKKKLYKKFTAPQVAWRKILVRVAATPIVFFYVFFGKTFVIVITGITVILSLGFDLYRILPQGRESTLFKFLPHLVEENRPDRFSSITIFLITAFSVVLIFPTDIALLSLSFLIGGGVFAFILGVKFGRNRLIGCITLEMCFSYLAGSLAGGYVVATLLDLDFRLSMIGAVVTFPALLLSTNIDDNFSVGILSGAAMSASIYLIS